jgi:uncharacterized protein YyaL (SSP411 family)
VRKGTMLLDTIWRTHCTGRKAAEIRCSRVFGQEPSQTLATLEDWVELLHAELLAAQFDSNSGSSAHLEQASSIANLIETKFTLPEGGYCLVELQGPAAPQLCPRLGDVDTDVPAGRARYAAALASLEAHTGLTVYTKTRAHMEYDAIDENQYAKVMSVGWSGYWAAESLRPWSVVVVAKEVLPASARTSLSKLVGLAEERVRWTFVAEAEIAARGAAWPSYLGKSVRNGRPTYYACRDTLCLAPTGSLADLAGPIKRANAQR